MAQRKSDYRKVYKARKSSLLGSIEDKARDYYKKAKQAVEADATAATPELLGPRLLKYAGNKVKEALGNE